HARLGGAGGVIVWIRERAVQRDAIRHDERDVDGAGLLAGGELGAHVRVATAIRAREILLEVVRTEYGARLGVLERLRDAPVGDPVDAGVVYDDLADAPLDHLEAP